MKFQLIGCSGYGLDVEGSNVAQRLNSRKIFTDFCARYGRRETPETEGAEKRLSPQSALESAAITTIQIGCVSGLNATVLLEKIRFLLESPTVIKVRSHPG